MNFKTIYQVDEFGLIFYIRHKEPQTKQTTLTGCNFDSFIVGTNISIDLESFSLDREKIIKIKAKWKSFTLTKNVILISKFQLWYQDNITRKNVETFWIVLLTPHTHTSFALSFIRRFSSTVWIFFFINVKTFCVIADCLRQCFSNEIDIIRNQT